MEKKSHFKQPESEKGDKPDWNENISCLTEIQVYNCLSEYFFYAIVITDSFLSSLCFSFFVCFCSFTLLACLVCWTFGCLGVMQ